LNRLTSIKDKRSFQGHFLQLQVENRIHMGAASSISGEKEMKRLYELKKNSLSHDQRSRLEQKYQEVKARSRGFTAASLNACCNEWDVVVSTHSSNQMIDHVGSSPLIQAINDKWDELNAAGGSDSKNQPKFDLSPSENGAWRTGAAPVTMFTQFLLAVQAEKIEEALDLSERILDYEPDNKIIKEYQPVLLEKKRLRDENEADSEEESGDESESGDEENSDGDENIFQAGGDEDADEVEQVGQKVNTTTLHKLRSGWLIENQLR
jgi:hypothetical protein